MPEQIKTSGNVGLDRELDDLRRRIKALEAAASAKAVTKTVMEVAPSLTSGDTTLNVSNGTLSLDVSALIIGSGLTLSGSGNAAQIVLTPTTPPTTVTTLNGLSGAVVLAAGTNVTLSTAGSTITINASAAAGGVTSLNTLTGALTLAAGANVTLTTSGSTLTLAVPNINAVESYDYDASIFVGSNNTAGAFNWAVITAGTAISLGVGGSSYRPSTVALGIWNQTGGGLTITPGTGNTFHDGASSHTLAADGKAIYVYVSNGSGGFVLYKWL